jgi:hypothetical protein
VEREGEQVEGDQHAGEGLLAVPVFVLKIISVGLELASRPGEFHPQALPDPYVKLSLHTAPDVQSPTKVVGRPRLGPVLIPLPVGSGLWLNNAAPSVRSDYRTFNPTTGHSAPVPRIGTLALAVFAT